MATKLSEIDRRIEALTRGLNAASLPPDHLTVLAMERLAIQLQRFRGVDDVKIADTFTALLNQTG